MHELEYSRDAFNALSAFYRCDKILYVEGDDDELFWAAIFEACTGVKVVAESLGGSEELDKRISRIIEDDLDVLAARDADYGLISGRNIQDPRILYTYGYSIENTLYNSLAVAQIARLWTKGKNKSIGKIANEWLDRFYSILNDMIVYDFANDLHDCGVSVVGDSISKFSDKANPHELNVTQVQKHLKFCAQTISIAMLSAAENKLAANVRQRSDWLRGHFLTSAILQFVSAQIKQAGLAGKISYNALYVSALQQFEATFKKGHPHFEYYETAARSAVS
ncbi:hypothetical protein PCA20602_02870 [Pandoraea capi]|uniref:DUF4435 domain-containing protein n=1 Tax=Pandoraea capi TaxID=2508286 RepID=A0ABY6W1T7_9BURK|nr:DUF4435 domain-containing protein [Pandoraea capi]VVE15654.1 hypothetical protein PCA20602_02870 [Pandoraea capi]